MSGAAGRRAPAVQEALAAVAAHGLPGRIPLHAALPRPLDADSWVGFLQEIRHERLSGLLAWAIVDDAFPVTEGQRGEAEEAHLSDMHLVVRLERSLLHADEVLHAASVDWRLLKGSAVAFLDYPDPSLRPFGDVDLLVTPAGFDSAVGALAARGWSRQFPEPRPGFDSRFGKGTTLSGPDGYELDLHRSFVAGPFAQLISPDDLFETPAEIHIGDRPVQALAPEQRFLHACFHALLGDAPHRLVPLRDVAQMLLNGRLDWDRVRRLAARWQGAAVVAGAVRAAWSQLGGAGLGVDHPVARWAAAYRPDRREQRHLVPYRAGATYAGQALAAVTSVRGVRAKAAYLRAMVLPEPSYLEGRDRHQMRRWARGARAILGRPERPTRGPP